MSEISRVPSPKGPGKGRNILESISNHFLPNTTVVNPTPSLSLVYHLPSLHSTFTTLHYIHQSWLSTISSSLGKLLHSIRGVGSLSARLADRFRRPFEITSQLGIRYTGIFEEIDQVEQVVHLSRGELFESVNVVKHEADPVVFSWGSENRPVQRPQPPNPNCLGWVKFKYVPFDHTCF